MFSTPTHDARMISNLAVAVDKSASADPQSLADAIDQIVGEMHDDGTLTKLSEKWYDGVDLSTSQQ